MSLAVMAGEEGAEYQIFFDFPSCVMHVISSCWGFTLLNIKNKIPKISRKSSNESVLLSIPVSVFLVLLFSETVSI